MPDIQNFSLALSFAIFTFRANILALGAYSRCEKNRRYLPSRYSNFIFCYEKSNEICVEEDM